MEPKARAQSYRRLTINAVSDKETKMLWSMGSIWLTSYFDNLLYLIYCSRNSEWWLTRSYLSLLRFGTLLTWDSSSLMKAWTAKRRATNNRAKEFQITWIFKKPTVQLQSIYSSRVRATECPITRAMDSGLVAEWIAITSNSIFIWRFPRLILIEMHYITLIN